MFRRYFMAGCALLLAGASAGASETALNGQEVYQLLRGNTASGLWQGTPYKSYFDPNGATLYMPQTGEPALGKWRINPDTGQYESWWEHVGWTSYTVVRTDTGLAWVHEGQNHAFTIESGRQLSW
ncbi:hypothetical protein KO491_04155 [Roseovarius nubinhibens]|jgi:hypothetical protein|uniref:hypothetical protein n=1 Tax=Roseovarius nubinhibens TaxID=314263 RepID=UPI000C50D044|nr:hypothetical protein [Roseovarius nubinhibens]MAO26226.1 hypothetical protein [Roseovarius sp.]MBU2999021.1 hypothetical protein [Roseovarius nubinhibens]